MTGKTIFDRFAQYCTCIIVLFSLLAGGCSAPPSMVSLADLLQRHGISVDEQYTFGCTAGAHRGASVDHRENTMAALMAADGDDRYAFVEFDVQYTKDGEIVVYHDKRLLRLFGSLKAVGNSTLAELRDLSDGEIAVYHEVISVLNKKINIEIKSQGDAREDQRLADEIIADVKARKREGDILISSISGEVLLYIKKKYPHIQTGQVMWLASSTYLPFDGLTRNLYKETDATGADYLLLHVANLHNIGDLIRLKPRGKTVLFWDFDDSLYLLHKDLSDRLWGESVITALLRFLRYRFVSFFQHLLHGESGDRPDNSPEIWRTSLESG